MTQRQQTIARLALVFLNSNLDAACDAMANCTDEDPDNEAGKLNFNGEVIEPPTEEEIAQLLKELQG